MPLKQLNATYLLGEDRILFRITDDKDAEYRFWLTRRITLFILQAAQALLLRKLEGRYEKETAQAIADFDRSNLQSQIQSHGHELTEPVTTQATYAPGSHFPLGFDPVLVMDVRCTILEESFAMDFILPANANMNLHLPLPLFQMMCALLDRLGAEAQWGDKTSSASTQEENELQQTSSATKQLH